MLLPAAVLIVGVFAVVLGVQRPVLAIAGILGLAFLVVADRSPVLGLVVMFAVTFLGQMIGSSTAATAASKGTGGALVLVWVYRLISRRDDPVGGPEVRVFVAVASSFLIWGLSSALWADDPHRAISATLRLAQGPLLMLVIVGFVRTRAAFLGLCFTYLVGATLSAAAGFVGIVSTSATDGRLTGGVGDPNFLAAVLVTAVALALFMALAPGQARLRRGVLLGLCVVCLIGLVLTGSRGGVVALATTFVLANSLAGPVRAQLLGVALVAASLSGVYLVLIAPSSVVSRSGDFGQNTGRTDLWTVATNVFKAHPVQGVGLDNFQVVSPTYAAATDTQLPRVDIVVKQHAPVHNTYLQLLAELGVIGELLALATLGVVLVAAWSAVRRLAAVDIDFELAGRGLLVGTVGLLAAFFFLTGQYEKQLWLTLGLLLSFATVTRRELAARAEAPARSASEAPS